MRRTSGTLVPLEADILAAAIGLLRAGTPRFHGFQLAKRLADNAASARRLTAHGTLYKALSRLQETGLLESVWEDPDIAAAQGRPRRRLYELTSAGERALAAWQAQHAPMGSRSRPGLEPA